MRPLTVATAGIVFTSSCLDLKSVSAFSFPTRSGESNKSRSLLQKFSDNQKSKTEQRGRNAPKFNVPPDTPAANRPGPYPFLTWIKEPNPKPAPVAVGTGENCIADCQCVNADFGAMIDGDKKVIQPG